MKLDATLVMHGNNIEGILIRRNALRLLAPYALRALESLNQEDGSRHSPRAKSWMDKVREFFAE